MNGNPSAAQKRYHDELRQMYYERSSARGVGELHHIWGSKAKFKLLSEAGIDKAGEWFVVMLPKSDHDNINNWTFEEERGLFMYQQRAYAHHFNKPSPVPKLVSTYYQALLSKQYILKRWPVGL